MLSLWYHYRDGAFHCATGADVDVVGYLKHDTDIAFEISDNDPPTVASGGRG
jgi:hypothetical protein